MSEVVFESALVRRGLSSSARVAGHGVDRLIIAATLLYCMVWFWLQQWLPWSLPIKAVLAVLYISRALTLATAVRITPKAYLSLIVLGLALSANVLITGESANLVNNILQITYGLSTVLYFSLLILSDKEFLLKYFVSVKWVINAYMVVNMCVMFLQLDGTYFLINQSNLVNTFYDDLVAGLLGQNGTHRVTCLFVMTLLLNIKAVQSCSAKEKIVTVCYIAITVTGYSYLATQNDNITFLIVVPVMVFLYCACNYRINARAILVSIAIAAVILILVGYFIQQIDLMDLTRRLDFITQSYSSSSIQSSENRIRLLTVLFADWNGLTVGSGVGGLAYYNDPRIDDLHYGMNSMQSVVGMGGLSLFILLVLLYSFWISKTSEKVGKAISFLVCGIVILLFSYYTMPFSEPAYLVPILVSLNFIFEPLSYPAEKLNEVHNGEL